MNFHRIYEYFDSDNFSNKNGDPEKYEVTNHIRRIFHNEFKRVVWGSYQLNKFEKDIVKYINGKTKLQWYKIKNKPEFRKLVLSEMYKLNETMYRIEDAPSRWKKIGDTVDFDICSFSPNPYVLSIRFGKENEYGKPTLYKIQNLKGISISKYVDCSRLELNEEEYLCSGKIQILNIQENKTQYIVEGTTKN
jgi:hypothetical protein